MTKVIFKTILWGVVSWLALGLISLFGIGFYNGFISQNPNVEIPPTILAVLRYTVLFLALGIAAYIFIKEEEKYKESHIVAFAPKKEEPLSKTIPPPIIKPQVIKPPEEFFAAKPQTIVQPEFKPAPPPPQISTPQYMPKSLDLKQGPDQTPWS